MSTKFTWAFSLLLAEGYAELVWARHHTPFIKTLVLLPMVVFFLWVNYLFFFDADLKAERARPLMRKLILLAYFLFTLDAVLTYSLN